MAALVLGDRLAGQLFGGCLVATWHGFVHCCLIWNDMAHLFAAQHRRGREGLHWQGQHHENQQESFERGVHVGSLAKSEVVSK